MNWYIAKIVFRIITGDGNHMPQFDEQLRLINANNEEEAFEKIIDYFDEQEELAKALEATELAIERYPYSSALLLKRADLLIATKKYKEALHWLQQIPVISADIVRIVEPDCGNPALVIDGVG